MMHRAYGFWDVVVTQPEIHPPGAGGSISTPLGWGACNAGGKLGFWKLDTKVEIGAMHDNPMGLGHDGGPGRVHILVVVPPVPAACVAWSAICTALSGVKPHFTAHKVQINAGGSALPICCQLIPSLPTCNLSLLFCSTPSLPNIGCPVIPTHTTLWVGMTLGDVIGGLINIAADMLWDLATQGIGDKLDKAGKIAKTINKWLPWVLKGTSATGINTGPTNLGGLAQRLIDNDGITSDADSGFTIFGVGVTFKGRDKSITPHFAYPKPTLPWSP